MKTICSLVIIALFVGLTGFSGPGKKEDKAKKRLEMAQLIESGHFRFVARSASSYLGTFNNLSPNYDLVFDSLRVKAFLPYYGRAYSASYGSNEGGVKFDLTTEKIERSYDDRKKLYLLSTEIKDSKDSYSIRLSAGLDGYADLRISFTNRQWISYYGSIEKTAPATK